MRLKVGYIKSDVYSKTGFRQNSNHWKTEEEMEDYLFENPQIIFGEKGILIGRQQH